MRGAQRLLRPVRTPGNEAERHTTARLAQMRRTRAFLTRAGPALADTVDGRAPFSSARGAASGGQRSVGVPSHRRSLGKAWRMVSRRGHCDHRPRSPTCASPHRRPCAPPGLRYCPARAGLRLVLRPRVCLACALRRNPAPTPRPSSPHTRNPARPPRLPIGIPGHLIGPGAGPPQSCPAAVTARAAALLGLPPVEAHGTDRPASRQRRSQREE